MFRIYAPMVRSRWLVSMVLAVGTSAAALAQPVSAGAAGAAAPAERSDLQWLRAVQEAAQTLSYSGTIVYHRGGAIFTSRVVHYFDGNASHERLEVLDGRRREYIRRDNEVQCLYPEVRRVRIEHRPEQDRFPAIGAGTPEEILVSYRLSVRGVERVADTECRVLMLEPKDALRYGHWLCVEARSALLIKARTLDAKWQPIEQMAFVNLRIGGRPDPALLRPSWPTDGWTVERVDLSPADLKSSGWQIVAPPGFLLQRAVQRSLASDRAGKPTLHVVYSDGVATLSVFIDTGAAAGSVEDEVRRLGPTSAFARRAGDARITVVGEVPPATVRQVAYAVTRAPAR